MLTSRIGGAVMRRGFLATSAYPATRSALPALPRCSLRSAVSHQSTSSAQSKATKISESQCHEILTKQRLNRPISPHLEVYRLSQTYLGSSAWMRITGSSLLGVGYLYFIGYLVSPLFGVDIGSASIVSAFSELPELARAGIKAVLAWPFSFHFCNGIKQLIYDSGWGYPYNKVTMSRNDLYVFAVSAAMAAGLVFGL